MSVTAEDLWDKALDAQRMPLTVDAVVELADHHASLGHGGLLLKGRLADTLFEGLRKLRYDVVVVPTTYEAMPVITLISWS